MLIGAGIALVLPDGAVLVGRRVYAGEVSSWCFPGGKLDAGETFAQAVIRETFEETGIALAPDAVRPLGLILDTYRAAPRVTAAFTCAVGSGALASVREPLKIAEWGWFAPQALPQPLFDPTDKILDLLAGRPPRASHGYRIEPIPG